MSRVTLTFDNGPHPEVTPAVLDILRRHDVTSHFFVLGKNIGDAVGRGLVARARDLGHRIGNHSFSHAVPLGQDPRPDAVFAEIVTTAELLAPLVPGAKSFRPFGGGGVLGPHLLSKAAVDHLVANAYTCALWSSVPHDWDDPAGWPARAVADCAAQAHAVVVLHDVPGACLAGLERFLETAAAEGVEFVADLPRACTPIVHGELVGDLRGIVAD